MINSQNRRPNLSDVVYEEIKEMIFSGELAQGERIILETMAEKMNLSVTPVREALRRLSLESLVVSTPRTSNEVVSFTAKEIEDIFDLRILLEEYAIQSCNDSFESVPIESLRAKFTSKKCINDPSFFIATDLELHKAIIAGSSNKKLEKHYNLIWDSIRVLILPSSTLKGRTQKAIAEHLDILDAMQENDPIKVMKHLSNHLNSIRKLLVEHCG